ncbi:hypothetical protein CC80DRAFT_508152 [Byssothecium circinans]|uniref:Uncharacterized protein n=1 Tax=Byssothecium circinans TaxID=147558 RepID=A0A6A5TJ56_9PLEO|nr:hypothetical protein CC80DRAFT_508152 [Byssothecium circinans]
MAPTNYSTTILALAANTSDTALITKSRVAGIIIGILTLVALSIVGLYFLIRKYEWVRRGFQPKRSPSQCYQPNRPHVRETPEQFVQSTLSSLRSWRRPEIGTDVGSRADAGTTRPLGSSRGTVGTQGTTRTGTVKTVRFDLPSTSTLQKMTDEEKSQRTVMVKSVRFDLPSSSTLQMGDGGATTMRTATAKTVQFHLPSYSSTLQYRTVE